MMMQTQMTDDRIPMAEPGRFPIGSTGAAVHRDGGEISVIIADRRVMAARFHPNGSGLTLTELPEEASLAITALSAAAEAVFGWHPRLDRIALDFAPSCPSPNELVTRALAACGLAVELNGQLTILSELAMQRPDNWLSGPRPPAWPKHYALSEGKRHPRRPPKPEGVIYSRFIPWLAETVSFRVASLDRDLPTLHCWLNDPRVDVFWNEAGEMEKHRHYLTKILADPHMLPLIGCFGDVPFGYFEVYWAKENRIAPFYDVDDYDRGWHVIVGEDAFRGRRYITAWLPSLMHYMFLDDCRTQRIVGEPAAAHVQQLRNLDLAGFARVKNFDFPHKRATLVMLLRERFFADRLWQPASDEAVARI